MKQYSIKINNRFLSWCDEHWYETTSYPINQFKSIEEASETAMQLGKHYVYKSQIVDEAGNVVKDIDYLQEKYHSKIETKPLTLDEFLTTPIDIAI